MKNNTEVVSPRHLFCVVVDAQEFQREHPLITAGEIMDLAGIPRSSGLLEISPDRTQRVVGESERFNLAEFLGKFKRCPTFVRG